MSGKCSRGVKMDYYWTDPLSPMMAETNILYAVGDLPYQIHI